MSSPRRTTLFLGGLSPCIPLQEYEEFFASFLSEFELRLSGKTEGRVSNGYGYLVTPTDTASELLAQKELHYRGSTIVCMPYLSGEELRQHHKKLNSRRIIVRSSFPIDQRELEQVFSTFGKIESAYLRSEPKKIQRHLAVVIYYNAEAAEKAIKDYNALELHPKYSVHSTFKTTDEKNPINNVKSKKPSSTKQPPLLLLQTLTVTPRGGNFNKRQRFKKPIRTSENGNTNDMQVKPKPYKLEISRKIVKRSLHFIPSNHNPENLMFSQPDSYTNNL